MEDENRAALVVYFTLHGMTASKEHMAWAAAIQRVTNPNNVRYETYQGRGFDPDWINDFKAFYDHIGPAPVDGQRWSLGRIDNNLGYIKGNVQWELPPQQSRNKSMPSNNTSGVVGVSFNKRDSCWTAFWVGLDGKKNSRNFKVAIYGEEQAKQMAIDRRLKAIQDLNAKGAGYSETHGLPRPEAQGVCYLTVAPC